jgi:hypothetical protein
MWFFFEVFNIFKRNLRINSFGDLFNMIIENRDLWRKQWLACVNLICWTSCHLITGQPWERLTSHGILFVWQILLGFYKEFLQNCFWFYMNGKATECYTLSKAGQDNRTLKWPWTSELCHYKQESKRER